MSQHYQQALIGSWDYAHCNHCGRQTKHRIVRATATAGKLGHCLEHVAPQLTKAQQRRREEQARQNQNPRLF